ncbi:tudor domain-containing protein 1 isoform X1 [Lethenteron reissneri]|uniref:tudor domain-containing protein 1 isoform X1 n=1 Tax=Lethenteron reissneri TaxID=7753 RepID=UPI002AB63022|nr:tudor domain-containing protein 1 isoform X1 [Lethenteron reissneri]
MADQGKHSGARPGRSFACRFEEEVGEKDLDVWNPMREDFKNVSFNSYNRGPGARLPMWAQPANSCMAENGIPDRTANSSTVKSMQIFVNCLPQEMTEEAMKKLFSQSGDVLYVKKILKKHGPFHTACGFVVFSKLSEAMDAIRRFNRFQIGSFTLQVSFSRENDTCKKQQEESFLLEDETMKASNASSGTVGKSEVYGAQVEPKTAVQMAAATPAVQSIPGISLDDLGLQFVPHGEAIQCMVTEWQNPGRFYVQQLTSGTETGLRELLALCQGPDGVGGPPTRPGYRPWKGDVCAALFSQDQVWYRVVVSEVDEARGCILAYFLDYGSWEEVAFENVRPPPEEFRKHPPYTLQCSLTAVRPRSGGWSDDVLQLRVLLLNQTLVLRVEEYDEATRTYMVDLEMPITGRSLRESLLEEGICVAESVTSCSAAPSAPLEGIGPGQDAGPTADTGAVGEDEKASGVGADVSSGVELERGASARLPCVGESFNVVVGDLVNPGLFYCQRTEFAEELAKVMAMVACLGSEPEPPKVSPCVGQVVSAQYLEDNVWYRAMILDVVSEDTVKVCYMDFGNCECLKVSRLRAIPHALLKLPAQALRCCLSGIRPVCDAWSVEATGLLVGLVSGEILRARVVARDARTSTLEVKLGLAEDPVCDFSELLVRHGVAALAAPDEISPPPSAAHCIMEFPVGVQFSVTVTDVQHPGHFYCIRLVDSEIQALQEVLVEVASYCDRTKPQPDFLPKPGQLCCARYSSNGSWYRARVLACDGELVRVEYPDFGNSEEVGVQDLRPLDGDGHLLRCPFMAFRCSLAGVLPVDSDSWSPESTEALLNLVSDRCLRATVMAPRAGDAVPVDLQDMTAQQEDSSQAAPDAHKSVAHQLALMGLAVLAEGPGDLPEDREPTVRVCGVRCGSNSVSDGSSVEAIATLDDRLPGVPPTDACDRQHPGAVAEGAEVALALGESRAADDPSVEAPAVPEGFVVNDPPVLLQGVLSEILTEVTEAVKMLEPLMEAKRKLERVVKLIQRSLEEEAHE